MVREGFTRQTSGSVTGEQAEAHGGVVRAGSRKSSLDNLLSRLLQMGFTQAFNGKLVQLAALATYSHGLWVVEDHVRLITCSSLTIS